MGGVIESMTWRVAGSCHKSVEVVPVVMCYSCLHVPHKKNHGCTGSSSVCLQLLQLGGPFGRPEQNCVTSPDVAVLFDLGFINARNTVLGCSGMFWRTGDGAFRGFCEAMALVSGPCRPTRPPVIL